MAYLFYLKASVKRSFRRHLSLYLTQTCAFTLPIIFSVFRDSADLGLAERDILLAANAAVIVVTVYLLLSAYKSHFDAFDAEIGVLSAIGAGYGQIKRIFALEYITVFILAAASAGLVSVFAMRALISGFFGAGEPGYAMRLVFRVKPLSMALNIGALFLSLLITQNVFASLKQKRSAPPFLSYGGLKHCIKTLKPGDGAMSVVEVRELTKTYKQGDAVICAVNCANLNVYRGEFMIIVGKSGSGKSTLLNIIGCVDKPTKGGVTISGVKTAGASGDRLAQIRRQKIGYVYQNFNLIPILTAKENIILPLLLDGNKFDEAYFEELVNLLDIKDKLGRLPSEMSGGQQQRVAIARALINRPSVILADEPTGNLDKKSSDEIIKLLIEINKRGSTILLVTHNEEYAKLSTRRVVIDDGKLTVLQPFYLQ